MKKEVNIKAIGIKMLILLVLDLVIIWYWVIELDPDNSAALAAFFLVIFLFVGHMVLGVILIFFKQLEFSILTMINAFIAPLILWFMFFDRADRNFFEYQEEWSFSKKDTIFRLQILKERNEFDLDYGFKTGEWTGFIDGKLSKVGDVWILENDSLKMKIIDDRLIGFRFPKDTIEMTPSQH